MREYEAKQVETNDTELTAEKVNSMLAEMGQNRKTVDEFVIPDYITVIQGYAFSGCYHLQHVQIPDCVYFIGRSAFEDCYHLEDLKLPRMLECIDSFAFRNCREIRELQFNENLQIIGSGAFEDCYGINKLYFPSNIKFIENGAFFHCRELRSVRFAESGLIILGDKAFGRCRRFWKFKEKWFPDTLANYETRWEAFVDSPAGMPFSFRKLKVYYSKHTRFYRRG